MTSTLLPRATLLAGAVCALAVLFSFLAAPAGARGTVRKGRPPKPSAASTDAGADAAPSKAPVVDGAADEAQASRPPSEAREAAAPSSSEDETSSADGGMDPSETSEKKVAKRKKPPPTDEGEAPEDEDNKDGQRNDALGGEVDLESRFIWRGLPFSDGPVLQPSTWAYLYGLTVQVWGNVMLNDEPTHDRVSALVPSASFAFVLGRVKLEPGAMVLYTPSEPGPQTTSEGTLEMSYQIGSFHLVSGTYVDIQSNPGAYFGTFGADYERTFHDWTIKATFYVGWATADYNDDYFGVDAPAFDLIDATLSVRYDITDLLYFSLHTEESTLLHPALRRSTPEPTIGSGGASFGIEY